MGRWRVSCPGSSNILRSRYETNRYIGSHGPDHITGSANDRAGRRNGTDMVLAAKSVVSGFKTALQDAAHKTIKFANQDGINIYQEPSTEAVVLDQAFLNTSFEVLGEYGDWSMITTEAGHAYIETKCLSGIEIRRPSYSEEDLYILAHVICGEAQNCPDDEQLLVGSVVLNRVNHGQFPNTIKGVVFAPGQYSCTRDGNYYREPTASNWANAKWLLENGSILPGNVVWQSGGRQGRGEYLRTRYHSYCY